LSIPLNQEVVRKIESINIQFNEAIKNKDEIWNQYLNLKYGKNLNIKRYKIVQPLAQKAHKEMIIRDQLSEKFCQQKLKLIKQRRVF
jgi:hypothetical protein